MALDSMKSAFQEREFELDAFKFKILPVPYSDSKHMLETLRIAAGRLTDMDGMVESQSAEALSIRFATQLFGILNRQEVGDLETRMFKYMRVTMPDDASPSILSGRESEVFADNPFNSYEVLIRGVGVTLYAPLTAMLSRFGVDLSDSPPPQPQT